jgi:hypothetical protein
VSNLHRKNSTIIVSTLVLIILFTIGIEQASATSWSSTTTQLTTYDWSDEFPSIMQASDGRIWVVWSRYVNGYNALYYRFSSNMGYSWSTPMNLTKVPDIYDNTKPSIIQTMNGSLWVVWASNSPPPPSPDFTVSASPNSLTIPQNSSGTSTITVTSLYGFNDPVNLVVLGAPKGVSTTLNPVQVKPPQNGNANSTLTVNVGATATPGNYNFTVTGASAVSPTMKRNVSITLHITKMGTVSYSTRDYFSAAESSPTLTYDYEIRYRTSSNNGATWSNIFQLTQNTVDDLTPTILQLRNGTICIFYKSLVTGSWEIFYQYSSDGGATWLTKQLTNNSYADSYPSAIQTTNGSIWVAWDSERNNNTNIYYKIYDGSQWLSDRRLTTSSWYDSDPCLLETTEGLVWTFWTSTDVTGSGNSFVFYSNTSNYGGSWSPQTQFNPVDANEDCWPSAVQIRDTSIWVTFASSRTGHYQIFYKTSLVGDLTGPENPSGSGNYPPDHVVDDYDLAFMNKAYGAKEGDSKWSQFKIADITGPENPINSRRYPPDKIVSVYDLFALGKNFGKS